MLASGLAIVSRWNYSWDDTLSSVATINPRTKIYGAGSGFGLDALTCINPNTKATTAGETRPSARRVFFCSCALVRSFVFDLEIDWWRAKNGVPYKVKRLGTYFTLSWGGTTNRKIGRFTFFTRSIKTMGGFCYIFHCLLLITAYRDNC